MPSPIVIPFNFQPDSVAVKTGSYTIPAGSYAYVVAYASRGGWIKIDGSLALDHQSTITNVNVTATGTNTASHTVATDSAFEGFVANSVSTGWTFGGGSSVPFGVTGGSSHVIKLGPGGSVTSDATSSVKYIVGYEFVANETNSSTAAFWVPTGTAFTLSGDAKYTVSLFTEIS